MRTLLMFVPIALITISCSKDNLQPTPQFPVTGVGQLDFEYYYDFEDPDHFPSDTLHLKTVANVEINDHLYTAFFNAVDTVPSNFEDKDSKRLIYNFLPVRYEDGNYYEVIEYSFPAENYEICMLKDNLSVGDRWESTIIRDGDNDTIIYSFEVVDQFPEFSVNHHNYRNVTRIRQKVYAFNGSGIRIDIYESYHFYNKDLGIIRREIPPYQSGTYGKVIFDRIIGPT